MNEENYPQDSNYQSTAILKELADIKSNLAINAVETSNIKITISEIKSDIREIKSDFVNRREHNEVVKLQQDHEMRVRNLESIFESFKGKWAILAILGMAVVSAIMSYIIKKI